MSRFGVERLAVATLNLRGRHDRWLERRSLVVAEILNTAPDLISLQEVYRPIGQARWLRSQLNSRLGALSLPPYHLAQKGKAGFLAGLREGIAILSRFPILARDAITLGDGGRVALRVTVELPSGNPLEFIAVHLHHVAEDREVRQEQVMRLCSWLGETVPLPRQVIAGDFNEIPTGPAIVLMQQIYRSAFVEVRGYDPLATFPTALAANSTGWAGCLDYIFLSKAIDKVVDARLFCNRSSPDDSTLYPSDHVGLLATLEVAMGPHPVS